MIVSIFLLHLLLCPFAVMSCLLCLLSRLLVLQHGTSAFSAATRGAQTCQQCALTAALMSGSLPRPARRVRRLRHPQQRQQPLIFGGG